MEVPEYPAKDLGGALPEGSKNPKRDRNGGGGEVDRGVLIVFQKDPSGFGGWMGWGGDTGSQGTWEEATAVVQVGEDVTWEGWAWGIENRWKLVGYLGSKIYRTSGWLGFTGMGRRS